MCNVNLRGLERNRNMASKRSSMEESGTQDTKVSDSGYSNSCSNSQSQRSTGSSESRHSSSSRSSGYGGHQSTLDSVSEGTQQPQTKRKDKEHKKKKGKGSTTQVVQGQTDVQDKPQEKEVQSSTPEELPQAASPQAAEQTPPSGPETPPNESEALQIAALTHTLSCIKKLKTKDDSDVPSPKISPPEIQNQEKLIKCLKTEQVQDEGFSVVVSLRDGVVVCTTANMTDVLGYPKDMWLGRSLIDFIHPKHRVGFAGHITSVIASPPPLPVDLPDPNSGSCGRRNVFFCSLRQYRGLRSCGFSVADKPVSYVPCQLTTTFKEVPCNSPDPNSRMYLVITVVPVRSAYKYGDEVKGAGVKFTMRHLASTCVSHVDPEVTSHLGYLPQDVLGRSILDFYHHDDLPALKDTYEQVMKDHTELVRSKPYRLRCQNGSYALVETEYSTFINPWTHKMEFIVGQHSVLRGPTDPDVTTPVEQEAPQIPENVQKEVKALQDQIKNLFSEMVVQSGDSNKQMVSKRCKDLATFMEKLVETRPPDLKVDVTTEERSFSERDSVMLGEISPHHDYYNSNSSSGTPPSYNQLNYNDNLQRFFESKPKTTLSDESGESKNDAQPSMSSGADEDKGVQQTKNHSSDTSVQRSSCFTTNSGTSSGQSTETNSNGNSQQERNEGANAKETKDYKPPTLTEQLLTKHNEDMEKQMMQKHREQRSKCDSKSKDRHKSGQEKAQVPDESGGPNGTAHGVKRSGSRSWEGEPYKSLKTLPQDRAATAAQPAKPLNLWPPFSVGVVPIHTAQPTFTTAAVASPLVPMYYIPEPVHKHPAYISQRVSYVPDMVYHPLAMFGTPPVVYSPLAVLPSPAFPQTLAKPTHDPAGQEAGDGGGTSGVGSCGGGAGGSWMPPAGLHPGGGLQETQRPGSRATSVKAEPGSALCSVASASLQQPMSEKGKTMSSPGRLSPTLLSPTEVKKQELDMDSSGTSNNYDDSSIYSSFYSFLKTDKSDESMKSSQENDGKVEDMIWEKTERAIGTNSTPIKKVAPWLEDINMTQDLALKYQIQERDLTQVLQEDFRALERTAQPSMVNDQLSQMYLDLELEGLSRQLTLEESVTSSSDSSAEEVQPKRTRKKRYMEYDNMVILFEENAPLPPPPPPQQPSPQIPMPVN